jgi:hypothetical protein
MNLGATIRNAWNSIPAFGKSVVNRKGKVLPYDIPQWKGNNVKNINKRDGELNNAFIKMAVVNKNKT